MAVAAALVFSVSPVALSALPVQANSVVHENVSRVIDGSYIVTFNSHEGNGPPLIDPPNLANRGRVPVGESTTGQSRAELAAALGVRGEVAKIFESFNMALINMGAEEAARLERDPRVMRIDQDRTVTLATSEATTSWGLDRMDSLKPELDGQYNYWATGAGRTIYVVDSGISLDAPWVQTEFDGRASVVYDVNGGDGDDCVNHGTAVSAIAGGRGRGVAKGVTLKIAKITDGCTGLSKLSTSIEVFNWLAANAPRGTIVNWSNEISTGDCSVDWISIPLEYAIRVAYDAGVIIVVAAGNDGCDTADYSPVRIVESFVVGGTSSELLPGSDALYDTPGYKSRTGSNVSTFAPAEDVMSIDVSGLWAYFSGTSFAAPYISGLFAVVCQAAAPYCDISSVGDIYTTVRGFGVIGTVVDSDGTPLTNSTSRFIPQQW